MNHWIHNNEILDVFTDQFFSSKVTCDAPRHCCQSVDQGCEGKCIPESWINDGAEDCENGSDEYGRWKFKVLLLLPEKRIAL